MENEQNTNLNEAIIYLSVLNIPLIIFAAMMFLSSLTEGQNISEILPYFLSLLGLVITYYLVIKKHRWAIWVNVLIVLASMFLYFPDGLRALRDSFMP